MNVEQLCNVMRASSERYVSVESTMRHTRFSTREDKILNETDAESRWTPFRQYCRIQSRSYELSPATGSRDTVRIKTYDIGRAEGRRLVERPDALRRYKADIQKAGKKFQGEIAAYCLYWKMWTLSFYDWILITDRLDDTTLKFEEGRGLYILEIHTEGEGSPKAGVHRLFIDPAKGYLIMREETLVYENGEKIHTHEKDLLDIQKVNGLWVPMKHVWYEQANMKGECIVKSIRINEPISKESMEVEFPEGTEVNDHMRGVHYVAGQKRSTNGSFYGTDGDEPAPPLVKVYPEYVWIEPGQQEYVLAVDRGESGDPLQLQEHRFEGGGLVLSDLQDRISTTGNIILSLERPEAITEYVEGTLEMDLGGQPITVHLIAPPILD